MLPRRGSSAHSAMRSHFLSGSKNTLICWLGVFYVFGMLNPRLIFVRLTVLPQTQLAHRTAFRSTPESPQLSILPPTIMLLMRPRRALFHPRSRTRA